MIGGLVMATLNSGLFLMGVGQDKTQVIKGLVLLAAVAFDVYNKQQGRPSITGRLFGDRAKSESTTDTVKIAPTTTGTNGG